jgi:hypothetical protein
MITIQHARAKFTVQPEHAQTTYDLLALIDKSKGKRGAKLAQDKGIAKHDSRKRDYPRFNPACMLTSDYVTAYHALNHARLHLVPLKIEPALNRTPPELDPSTPEVLEELNNDA